MRDEVKAYFLDLQDQICNGIGKFEPNAFHEDSWNRPGGGGGRSRVVTGDVIQKGGVNFSAVFGTLSPEASKSMAGGAVTLSKPEPFFATGISLVIHPVNPFVPTVHANFRYFELDNREHWWFGGGADLTPYYLFPGDAVHFHSVWQKVCEEFKPGLYAEYKKWCDDYFYIKHRGEGRGVGGIFFDHLNDGSPEEIFAFIKKLGDSFNYSYLPIVEKQMSTEFNTQQKEWQEMRRGRYAEFNLVYDRGTTFGLRTDARIESVLMSLPPTVRWNYNPTIEPGTPEAELVTVLKEPKDWLGVGVGNA